MAFDWLHFLNARGVRYTTTGPNVARGHVAVRCPFCGAADPSEHMGISLEGDGWGCWRNRQHRGRHPAKLIMALLNCSHEDAMNIVGRPAILPDNFMARITQILRPEPQSVDKRKLKLPAEFKEFAPGKSTQRPYVNYLERKRGFSQATIARITDDYGVRYCTRGPYGYRIIFPVYHEGRLVTWTGRGIANQPLRYRTLPLDRDTALRQGYEPALGAITDYLWRYDELMESKADTIVLVEGPMDVLKTSILGRREGIEATCFFTSGPSERQVQLLHTLLPRFVRRWLLLDQGTLLNSMHIQGLLAGLGVTNKLLPHGVEDPGALQSVRFLLTG